MTIGLPADFAYPVYVIEEKEQVNTLEGNNYNVLATTKYGELPGSIVGANGLAYEVRNIYCFNLFGQGARIEDIYELAAIGEIREIFSRNGIILPKEKEEQLEREVEEQKRKSLHVDFIPEEIIEQCP